MYLSKCWAGRPRMRLQGRPRRRGGPDVVRRRLAALLLVAGLVQVTAPLAMAGTLAVTTFAGTGVAGDAGDGGEPTAARLRAPAGVAAVKSGAAVAGGSRAGDRGDHPVLHPPHAVVAAVGDADGGAGLDRGRT